MDRVSDAIGLIAGVGGVILIVASWPRRRVAAAQQRHPSAGTPFVLQHDAGHGQWTVAVRGGHPSVTIDILTYRPAESIAGWISEPIIAPVLVEPGTTERIPSSVADPSGRLDVVVAWTVRHSTGDRTDSRMIRVGESPDVVVETVSADAVSAGRSIGFTLTFGLTAVFLAFASMVVGLRLVDGTRFERVESADVSAIESLDAESDPNASTPAPRATPVGAATDTTSISPEPPSSTTTASAGPPNATPTASPPPTLPPAGTTDPPTPTSTAAPDTTNVTEATEAVDDAPAAAPVTSIAATPAPRADGQGLVIDARIEDCRFGSDCLIAGFRLVGFSGSGEYVCEFGDESRFVFRYLGDGANDACATGGDAPSITIEVDGVRSATVVRRTPDNN